MPIWRRLAIAGVLGFIVALTVWALRPWTSSVALAPVDNRTPQAMFSCGALFGRDRVHPSNSVARSAMSLPRQPCTGRRSRQVLAVADLVAGVAGIVILVAVGRHRPVDDGPVVNEIY